MTMLDVRTQSEMADAAQRAGSGGGRIWRRLCRDSAYVLVQLPLAILTFVVLATGLSLGVGLAVTVIGLPLLAGVLIIARRFADIERLRLRWLDGRPAPAPRYRAAPPQAGWLRKAVDPLLDGQSWLDLAHGILGFAVALATWCIVFVWWSITLGGLTYFAYDWAMQIPAREPGNQDLLELMDVSSTPFTRIAFFTTAGLVFAVTLPLVARGCAAVQSSLARSMLTGIAQLHGQIEDLTQTRTVLAGEQAQAMRRLERDIHDGPQQRLVRLSMDLSRAQRQLDAHDSDAARSTMEEAMQQTRDTLDELRALSRGIAPPILVDRGLAPALHALAERSPTEVLMEVDLGDDAPALDAATESALYFVVSETLTNVAKHSGASRAAVTVTLGTPLNGARSVLARIGDNGVGGASLAKGHGLQGLADRVRGFGGVFILDSPPGGPTLVSAQLPCG